MKRSIQFLINHPQTTILSMGLLFLLLFLFIGCKEQGSSHLAADVQSCKDYFNNSDWDNAIETCTDAGTDETLHYAAQAYMARSGASLFSIMLDLSDNTENTSKVMFDKIPNTAAKRSDYNRALSIIMEDIGGKTEDMYLESLILSGLLVFDELKTLIALDWSDVSDDFTSCVDTTCDFSPSFDVSSDTLIFNGLGSTFYTNICGNASSETDVSDDLRGEGFKRNITVDNCTIQADSLLNYNKIAVNAYYSAGITEIKDALVPFKFYKNMDTGGNASENVGDLTSDVYFCKHSIDASTLIPTEPTSDDLKLSDCEILEYLKNPGF